MSNKLSVYLRKNIDYLLGIVASSVDKLGALLLFLILSRFISKIELGEFALNMTIAGMITILSSIGIHSALSTLISKYITIDIDKSYDLLVTGCVSFILWSTIISISSYLVIINFNLSFFSIDIQILAVIIFYAQIEAGNQLITFILNGLQRFSLIVKIRTIKALLCLFLPLTFILVFDYSWLYKGMLISSLCVFLIGTGFAMHSIAITYHNRQFHFKIIVFRELMNVAVPSMLSSAIIQPAAIGSRLKIANSLSGFGGVASFSAATKIQGLFNMIGNGIGLILVPKLSDPSNSEIETNSHINLYANWLLPLSVTIPLLIFPEVIELIFGKEFNSYTDRFVFSVVLVYGSISMFTQGLARLLLTQGAMWLAFLNNLIWAILVLVGLIFIGKWGVTGVSTVILTAYLITAVIMVPVQLEKIDLPVSCFISKRVILTWGVILLSFLAGLLIDGILLRSGISIFMLLAYVRLFKKIILR